MDDLKIPLPRPRTSFRDFVATMRAEHARCRSHDDDGPLKAWHEHVGRTIRWVIVCDQCGGHSHVLSPEDLATLGETP